MKKEIRILIAKYFANQISAEELEELSVWVKKEDNREVFRSYAVINFNIEETRLPKQDFKRTAWETLEREIKKSKKLRLYRRLGVAASIAVIVSLSLYIFNKDTTTDTLGPLPELVETTTLPGTNKAVLTTEKGVDVVLSEDDVYEKGYVNSNGKQLNYRKGEETASDELAYNFLTVPRGGQFQLNLSDGTKVWLNSASKIKYPKQFGRKNTRQVELLYGEAYFDVTSSEKYYGKGFMVLTQGQQLEVLGTEFNIKAYEDENSLKTTLVEGSVKIEKGNKHVTLVPEQQAIASKASDGITVSNIDVYDETSWKEGVFSFHGSSLSEIMKVVSRWYDVDVQFANQDMGKVRFNGVFRKDENLEEILEFIQATNFLNSYEVSNKKVLLK